MTFSHSYLGVGSYSFRLAVGIDYYKKCNCQIFAGNPGTVSVSLTLFRHLTGNLCLNAMYTTLYIMPCILRAEFHFVECLEHQQTFWIYHYFIFMCNEYNI